MTTTSDAPPMEVNDAQQRRRQFAQAQEAKFDQIRKEFRPVEGNPLITPLTRFMDVPDADLDVLYRIRKDGDFEMPPMPLLKTHIDEDNKPLNIRRYQKQMICHLAAMPRFIDGDSVGLGKAQPLNAEVLTPTGWCLMGDLRVGDAVVDPDGGIGQVEGIFPQGRRQVFTLTTSDGGSTEACGEHLWTVQTVEDRRRGGSRTLTTQQLLAQGLTGSPTGARKQWRRNRFFLPLPEPIEFADGEHLPLHPYLLGALLGDGSTRTWSPTLTTTDAEILQQVERSLPPNTQLVPSTHDPITHYLTRKTKVGRNPVRIALEDLGAWGHAAWEKHIPTCYLHASIPERKDLLAALLDTDGECSKAGLVYFHTTSPTLANDVATLIRSLGGIARVSSPRKKPYKHQGETRVGRPAYCVTIKTTFNPFMLRRKAARWKPQLLARAIVSITPTRVTETQCIRVSTQRHLYLTNDYIVTHNTLCSIAALCAYHEQLRREGKAMKVVVFTTTSTAHQWATEIERFSGLRPWVLKDAYKFKGDSKTTYGHKARLAQLQKFLDHPKLDVLICRYSQWIGRRKKLTTTLDADGRTVDSEGRERLSQEIRDLRDALKPIRGRGAMILDETHKIKNPESQIRAMVVSIHRRFHRVWGLTATAIKNHLEEFYSIAAAMGVTPLGSLNYFREHHCDWSLQNAGGRVVPKIVGYRGLDKFKVGMRPWYWGRSQAQVKEPLPKLTTIYHPVELSDEESKLLLVDIPSGNFALPPVLKKVAGEVELVERDTSNMMTMLSVYQLVSNSMALLDTGDTKAFHSPKLSTKEEILLDLLDGDLAGEKVIIYTKYRSWIDRLQHLTQNNRFTARQFLRITGAESGKARERNRLLFQGNPEYDFIAINSAAIEGVNLQQAAHLICLDLPWSWGDLIQLVGRMVRMASPHAACTLHILFARGTVDEYVIEIQKSKKGVFERILGSAGTVGLLEEGKDLGDELDQIAVGLEDESKDDFRDMLRAHAQKVGLGAYVNGTILAKESAGMRRDVVIGKSGVRAVTEEELEDRW